MTPPVDGNAAGVVVTYDKLWAQDDAWLGHRAQWHHRAVLASNMDTVDVIELVAILHIALNIDLPGAAKQVEVVYIIAAKHRLQGQKYTGHIDA